MSPKINVGNDLLATKLLFPLRNNFGNDLVATRSLTMLVLMEKTIWWPLNCFRVDYSKREFLVVTRL